jgi:hypothetical protein
MAFQIMPLYDFSNIVEFIENDAEINYLNKNVCLKSCDINNPIPTFQVFNLPNGSSIQINLIVENKNYSNPFCFVDLKTKEKIPSLLIGPLTLNDFQIFFKDFGIMKSKECTQINEVKICFKLAYQDRFIVLYTSKTISNTSSQAQILYCGPTHTFGRENEIFIVFNQPIDRNELKVSYELKQENNKIQTCHGILDSHHKSIFVTKIHENLNYKIGNIILFIHRGQQIIYSKEIYTMNNIVCGKPFFNQGRRKKKKDKLNSDGRSFDNTADNHGDEDEDVDEIAKLSSYKLSLAIPHRVALGELDETENIRNWIMKVPESLTSEDEYGDSALHNAILKNNDKAVLFLIQLMIACSASAHFNNSNDDGHTPLILLANSDCSLNHIEELVINGAKLDHQDLTGRNVLHYAVINSKLEIVKYIVEERKRDFLSLVNNEDKFGLTPLCYAVLNENCPEILTTFIKHCSEDDQLIIIKAFNFAKTKSCLKSLSIISNSSLVLNGLCQLPTAESNNSQILIEK